MNDPMNTTTVEHALRRLGEVVEYHTGIEILLVGGAAGMLTNLLGRNRVTTDCDVMVYLPPNAMAAVQLAAETVADELKLAPSWLNSDVQLRVDALPDGWEQRKQLVGEFQRLRVHAISRVDLIAMKVLAGRDQDIEDLEAMRVRVDDAEFVRRYLGELANKGTDPGQIDNAHALLGALEIHEHE
ncbi:MAG: hypothetical protein KC996_11480 [Phycisphaerales bacterium]|nr:hypothetical protein [Phycisphaerales bacterium]